MEYRTGIRIDGLIMAEGGEGEGTSQKIVVEAMDAVGTGDREVVLMTSTEAIKEAEQTMEGTKMEAREQEDVVEAEEEMTTTEVAKEEETIGPQLK